MIYGKVFKKFSGEKIIQENELIISPSAEKNMLHIVNLVSKTLIESGKSLEIASGSGQHIVQLASSLPNYIWQYKTSSLFRCDSSRVVFKLS